MKPGAVAPTSRARAGAGAARSATEAAAPIMASRLERSSAFCCARTVVATREEAPRGARARERSAGAAVVKGAATANILLWVFMCVLGARVCASNVCTAWVNYITI